MDSQRFTIIQSPNFDMFLLLPNKFLTFQKLVLQHILSAANLHERSVTTGSFMLKYHFSVPRSTNQKVSQGLDHILNYRSAYREL